MEDVKASKQKADVVVVSLHWGVHFVPRVIADYQVIAAKAAFVAGAGLIMGHHAHTPKAIAVHDGKTCFYSLGNFIMSSSAKSGPAGKAFEKKYGVKLDADCLNLAYAEDGKRSMIAKAVIGKSGVTQSAFLPVVIDKQLRPEVIKGGDARFADALRFMEWASADFPHRFTAQGDEIAIS